MSQPSYSDANGYISEQFFTIVFDTPLDSAHPPSLNAFEAQINGTDATISAVEIDSATHSVKLTFSEATLLPGDIIDFVYTDPTIGNDVNAIQGLDGADAASFSQSILVAITRPGPSAPPTPMLDAGSDSGSLGDQLTNDNTPTISGTADANATVKLYDTDGTTQLGVTTADGAGKWSMTSSLLGDGAHTLKVTQTDGKSQTSALSAGLTVTIDSAAGAPTTLAVAAGSDSGTLGDGISNVGNPIITGKGEANATVTLYDTDGTTLLGTSKADGSGKWSITSGNLIAGSHTLTAQQTDVAGNVSAASGGFTYVLDTTGPVGMALSTKSVTQASATNGATVATLSSTDITAVTYGFAVGNGVIDADNGKFTISGNSLVAAQSLSAGTYHLYLSATDAAGNSAYQIFTVSVTNAPTVSSIARTGSAAVLGSAPSVDYSVTFSENVTGVDASDFALTAGGSASGKIASVTGSGSTYTVTVDTLGGDGTLRLDLNASGTGIKNGGNGDIQTGYTSGETYTLDHNAPSAPSTPAMTAGTDTGLSSSDAITKNVTPVFTGTGEANAAVTLYDTDGTTVLGTASADGSGKWSITSSSLSEGLHTISVKQSDAAANVSTASGTLMVNIDTSAPSASPTPALSPASDGGISGDFLTNVRTPVITGVAEANARVKLYDTDGSTLLGTTSADGSGNWSITSSTLADGSHSLSVKQTDAAGNVSSASSALTLDIDTSTPSTPGTPALSPASDSGTLGDLLTDVSTPVITGTGTVGDTVSLYDSDGTTLLGTAIVDGSGNWSITSSTLADGNHSLSVKQTNAAGTVSGASSTLSFEIDTFLPTATITLDQLALKRGDTAGVTIVFDEAVTGFSNAALTVANGTLSQVATSDNVTWTATFTPISDVQEADNTITLERGAVTDAAGNEGSGITFSNIYAIDTLLPAATITLSDTALRIGETALVTFNFSEAITGFTQDDLTVAHGTLSAVSSSDGGITWTGTFTPDAAIEDASNVLALDQTGVTDLAGNAGSGAATSGNFAIDTVRPTATLSLSDTALKAGEAATLTVTFSEAVTGLTVDDLTVAHGALSALASADGGVTWTATYTPDGDVEDATNLITLANTGIADLAGNPGSGTTDSANFTLDTLRPTATMTLADTALKIGETTTVTFAFSEAVSGLTPDDLTVAHGTLSTPTSSDGGVTWTATFTPTADVENTGNLIRLNNAGITDAAGNPGSGTTDSNPYALDTRAPTATVTALAFSGDSGFSSSDRITRVAAQTITGRLSSPLSVGDSIQVSLDGGSTWRAAVATAGLETFSLGDVILGGSDAVQVRLVDAAGNLGAVQSIGYVLDTTPPATPRLLDLQTASDTDTGTGLATATEDNVTTLATPTFDVVLATEPGAGVNVGDTVTLTVVAANGTETALASRLLTAEDLAAGRASLTAPEQDDGTYTLRARLYDPAGNVRDFAALEVTIVTDLDGVTPSIEATARNGDFNQDGVPDSTQSNVTALPLLNAAAFAQGNQADPASFGALVVGIPAAADGSGTVTLDPAAQLAQVKVLASQDLGATFGADVAAQVAGLNVDPLMSGILDFTLKPKDSAGSLRDSDPLRPGLQTQVVLELPPGITADTYYKIGQTTADGPVGVYAFMATGENSDGARFVDLDGNGTPDRVVITFTDGALGDDDLTVNGQIRDPGFLGFAATGSGDTLRGDTTRANHFRDVLTGTDYADTISGLKRADRLYGHGGDDVLDGGRGRDRLYGDAGNDRLEGGKRGDWLYGGDGNDGLGGGRGHDRLYGEAGNDVLSGGAQQDLLIGGAGNDALAGGRGVDTYRYRAPALGQDDLAAGSHDRITEISAHNILDFDAAVESVLKFDGVALADLTQRTDVTGQIDAGSSIAFVVETGTLQIDVNGDGVFNAQQDVQIDLVGVNHVTYLPGQAAFLLSA